MSCLSAPPRTRMPHFFKTQPNAPGISADGLLLAKAELLPSSPEGRLFQERRKLPAS